jgi:hypothetical protein
MEANFICEKLKLTHSQSENLSISTQKANSYFNSSNRMKINPSETPQTAQATQSKKVAK